MLKDHETATLPISVLIHGPISPQNLVLTKTNQVMAYPPEAEQFIAEAWVQRAKDLLALPRPRVQRDSSSVIMLGMRSEHGVHQIIAGVSSYKYRYATGLREFQERFGTELVSKTIGADALMQ